MNEYLVAQLKQGRINKGMKQSDVTVQTGIKNTTLSNYENGVTEPDIDTFLCLCELYELDFVSIMEEAYGIKIPGRNFDIKPSEIEHLKKYRDLDDHGKEIVDIILEKERSRSIAAKVTEMSHKDESLLPEAAHYRATVDQTVDGKAHDDAIMDDDAEWK